MAIERSEALVSELYGPAARRKGLIDLGEWLEYVRPELNLTIAMISPAEYVAAESKYGPLQYAVDRFTNWQANVRAIAFALGDLRRVDRYGVTRRGVQYTGRAQLPPAGGTTTMTANIAAEILADAEQLGGEAEVLLEDAEAVRLTYRATAKETHPDRYDRDTQRFQLISQAKAVLDAHHGRTRP